MRIVFAFVIALSAVSAFADDQVINPDRPGIADGSMTVGRGTFQIETSVERDDQSHERDLSTPTLAVGDKAVDFELPLLEGGGSVQLSDLTGEKAVALVFGSYT